MSQENQDPTGTASDFLSLIARREIDGNLVNQHILDIIEKVNLAQRTLDADSCRALQAAVSVREAAIMQGNNAATSFATDLVVYLAGGGKGQDFLSQSQFAHWKDLQLGGIIKPEVVSMLEEPPTSVEMPILEIIPSNIHGRLEAGVEKVIASKAVEEPEKSPSENVNVKKLLENPDLWIESDKIKYTSISVLAALLVGGEWKEGELALAKAALTQTIIPKWVRDNPNLKNETVGIKLEQSGKNLMFSQNQVTSLINYMQGNLEKHSRSNYKISDEPISIWPSFVSKKKASRS